MYARVTMLEIDTVRVDMASAIKVFEDDVLPELGSQEGYAGVLVMTTPAGGATLVSFWDTLDAADANAEAGFYPDLLARHMTMFKAPPGRERYEVVFADLPVPTT